MEEEEATTVYDFITAFDAKCLLGLPFDFFLYFLFFNHDLFDLLEIQFFLSVLKGVRENLRWRSPSFMFVNKMLGVVL